MTLFQIIQILKEIALAQPNIKSATDGSIYDIMNTNPSVKYDVVHFSQTTHQSDEETDYYGLNIFYVSRLEDSLEDNRLQIQSIGKEVLDNIIRTFCENWGIDFPIITYTPFTQKFNDLCAGCYCNLRLEIPKEIICADDYIAEVVPGSGIKLQDIGITITQNGLIVVTPDAEYDGIGEIRIETNVPQTAAVLQDKEVEYTENGSYSIHPDPAYDGLSSVSVDVLVPDRYDEGYDDGKEDGEAEQKAKLTVTSFTENNTYTRENGWSAITVNVPQGQGYEEGYEDGVEDQKAKLSTTSVTENGTYTRADGYSAITVDVPQGQGYEEGYEDGEAAQKAKLTVTSFTQNNTYTRTDGWSAVTVNVDDRYDEGYDDGVADQKAKLSTTSVTENGTYTRADGYSAITVNVDDRYDEGYEDGYAAGAAACSGLFITALTLNVDSAITATTTATTTFAPLTSITDIYYTSSNPSIATIDSVTGEITPISNGTVTICTIDRWSGLQDCKLVEVSMEYEDMPLTFEIITGGPVYFKSSKDSFERTIQYRKNGGEWISITSSTAGTPINTVAGDIVQFVGNNNCYSEIISEPTGTTYEWVSLTTYHNNGVYSQTKFNILGNIMSLINSTSYPSVKTLSTNRAFGDLFYNNRGGLSAENLKMPATTLVTNCYYHLFYYCTNLTIAPELPATTLVSGCYAGMFSGCTSLVTAPALPAMSLANNCYTDMFNGCTSLTTAPVLPAITMEEQCYKDMFESCGSLAIAPSLPATTLAYGCYDGMFRDCGNLITAPQLNAKTLVSNCYRQMFDNCKKLASITCLATDISASQCTTSWVHNVSATGTFTKAAGMTSWTRGESGIPTEWNVSNNS